MGDRPEYLAELSVPPRHTFSKNIPGGNPFILDESTNPQKRGQPDESPTLSKSWGDTTKAQDGLGYPELERDTAVKEIDAGPDMNRDCSRCPVFIAISVLFVGIVLASILLIMWQQDMI